MNDRTITRRTCLFVVFLLLAADSEGDNTVSVFGIVNLSTLP